MTSRIGRSGLTLIELLIAVSIFCLCTVLVQGGILRAANFLSRSQNVLRANLWIEQRLWDLRESLFYAEEGERGAVSGSGSFVEAGREFQWDISPSPVSGGKDLYAADILVEWLEGNRLTEIHAKVYEAK